MTFAAYVYSSLCPPLDLAGEEERLGVRGSAGEEGVHHLHWRHREPPPSVVRVHTTPLPYRLFAMMCVCPSKVVLLILCIAHCASDCVLLASHRQNPCCDKCERMFIFGELVVRVTVREELESFFSQ